MRLSTAADLSSRMPAAAWMYSQCSMHVYVYIGFSVTSERSYQIDVLMFSSVFDERAISAQANVASAAASCLALPRATQQTTQKPASAPPRTCRTAPNVLLHVEDLPRTSLSAGRRRATLIRQAAPSPRAKATIGAMRGAWRVAVVWVLSCMESLLIRGRSQPQHAQTLFSRGAQAARA